MRCNQELEDVEKVEKIFEIVEEMNKTVDEMKRESQPEIEGKKSDAETKKKAFQTAFVKNGDWLIELVKNDVGTSFVLFNTKTGELAKHAQVQLEDGTPLVPPETNLIERNIVLLKGFRNTKMKRLVQ
jgi:hypothetical protein